MLLVFLGSDRKKTREALNAAVTKTKRSRLQITDTHSLADLEAAMEGGGMFTVERSVLLDNTFANIEMRERILSNLERLRNSTDTFFLLEEKVDTATKRSLAKYAEKVETFDAAKKEKDNAIFKMRFALEKGDKKALWVALMGEYATGKAPEAVHGFLFWAAKQIHLNARNDATKARGKKLLVTLAELPHEARRKGFDFEYALEKFVLSGV